MPDLRSFSITALSPGNISQCPRCLVSCTVHHSQTGELLRDFTGDNAVEFPAVLKILTGQEQRELVELVANWLVYKRMGA